MPTWLSNYPLWVIFLALFASGTLRGQATYWLARGATGVASRRWARLGRWVGVGPDPTAAGPRYGQRVVRRWGLAAVPLCYLTVGVQSLVLAAAGVLRLPWVRFTMAQVVGVLAWATIYTTIGWALWVAAFRHATNSPWVLAAAALALGVVAATTWLLHRRRAATLASPGLPPMVTTTAPTGQTQPVEVR